MDRNGHKNSGNGCKAAHKKGKCSPKVSPLMRAFAVAYVELQTKGKKNGTRAAKLAGYQGSEGTLAATASKLLKDVRIQEIIRETTERVAITSNMMHTARIMDSAEVLARTSMLAYCSAADLLNEKGEFDIEDVRRRGLDYLLVGIKIRTTIDKNGNETTIQEFKIEPRKGFLELLGKHHGLWTDEILDPDTILSKYLKIPKGLLPASLDLDPNAGAITVEAEESESDSQPT